MMPQNPGRILTFYSYKGGTGRTMALSNIAWVLASNGYDVLLIDWDLEAPGLHRYLRPFLIDRELTTTPGLIDFVWDCAQASITPADAKAAAAFPALEDYAVGLDWDFGERGSISFIPAGRQDDNYAQRVNTFNWDNFYERLGGGKILEAERERLRATYDYILIDSRTGVSDTSSICTVHMPDVLLVFFTLNRQSIKGSAAVAHSIRSQRSDLPIFPVPTRIENTEADKRDAALGYAKRMFAPFLLHVQTDGNRIDLQQQAEYWNQVETPYRAFYAFEEVPAAFKDEPGGRNSVLAPSERIAHWISGSSVSSHRPVDEARRSYVVNAFAFRDNEDALAELAPATMQVESGASTGAPPSTASKDAVAEATSTNQQAKIGTSIAAPPPAPIELLPAQKVEQKPTLWQVAAAALALVALMFGVLWWFTSSQLATKQQLFDAQADKVTRFQAIKDKSLDELADAAVKLDSVSGQNNRPIVTDIKHTVNSVRTRLKSAP